MKRFLCVFAVLIAVAVVSLDVNAAESDVLARVGDSVITRADLDWVVGMLPDQQQAVLKSDSKKLESVLQSMVRSRVIADMAREQGYDKRADVKRGVKLTVDDMLAKSYVKNEVGDPGSVSDKDAEAYYLANRQAFISPEIKARHILIKADMTAKESDPARKKAKERAEKALARVKAGEDFAKVAERLSEDEQTKEKGGDLGSVRMGQMVPEFEAHLVSMKPGEVSNIVESRFGFHIVKVESRKEAPDTPYASLNADTKKKIKQRLVIQKTKDFTVKIMQDPRIKMYPEKLQSPKN